ncbi:MAG: VWA domain-containing protein, partial [Psychrobium sp.]|nr:VWA domain-containing protein [Psychrobium sp.]
MELFISQFHLLRPWFLLAIVPAIALYVMLRKTREQQGLWHKYLPPHLADLLVDGQQDKQSSVLLHALLSGWLLIAVALAGPTWQKIEQPLFDIKQAQVIAVDMSLSMYATDLMPNRLARAKFKLTDLIKNLSEGETGLIAYAGDAFVLSPMTQDVANLLNLIPALKPEIMPTMGSRAQYAVEKAIELLEQANHQQGSIYLITDGISGSDARAIRTLLKDGRYTLNILGIGTSKGAPIKLPDGQLLKDGNGNIVLPTLDEHRLSQLSGNLGGIYSSLSLDDRDIKLLTSASTLPDSKMKTQQSEQKFGDKWQETGPYLVLLILPFFVFVFRRGAALALLLCVLLPAVNVTNIHAAELKPIDINGSNSNVPDAKPTEKNDAGKWWRDLWKTPDQQAIDLYNAEQFDIAAQTFDDQRWRGASYYQAKEYEQALQEFEKGNNPQALYNQGNALTQLKRYDEAIERYQSALLKRPDWQQAKDNLDTLLALKRQQDEKKSKDDSQDKSQSDDDKEQQKSDQDGDESDKQEQGDKSDENKDKGQQEESDDDASSQKDGGEKSDQGAD